MSCPLSRDSKAVDVTTESFFPQSHSPSSVLFSLVFTHLQRFVMKGFIFSPWPTLTTRLLVFLLHSETILFYFFFTKEHSFLQSNLKTNMVLAERACLVTVGLPYQLLSLPSRVFSLGSSLFLCPSPLLEKELANYSSILAWRIPWTEEPGELRSIGSQKESDMTKGT